MQTGVDIMIPDIQQLDIFLILGVGQSVSNQSTKAL
jgi:hypothetical protein